MENNGRYFLEEIKAEIETLRSRLDALERKVAEVSIEEKPMEYVGIASFDEPIDIDFDDVPFLAEEPAVDEFVAEEQPAVEQPVEETDAESVTEAQPVEDIPAEDLPADEPETLLMSEPEPEPQKAPAAKPAKKPAGTSYSWRTDMAGSPVANIISGISLNDRVLFINTLFSEDPILFQASLARFNAMGSLQEAEDYIAANFPGWNLSSEVVYRFMMAVRRKLK